MFFKSKNMTFMFIMACSTIVAISSSSWMNAWLGLEINMMSFLPILLNKQTHGSVSSGIKYFLVQAMASMLLMIMIMVSYNAYVINFLNLNNEIILLALAMKSGIPPFHLWLPQVIEKMDVSQMFMTLSWQKIAPMTLMSYSLSELMLLIVAISAVVGAVGGYGQVSIKKIMAYSSMTHASWMVMAMLVSVSLWTTYFTIYNISLLIMCLFLKQYQISVISETTNMMIETEIKMILMLNLLSMGGLPPFVGFAAKMLVLKMCMLAEYFLVPAILVMMSFLSLYYYLMIGFSSFMMSEKKNFSVKVLMSTSSIVLIYLGTMMTPMLTFFC